MKLLFIFLVLCGLWSVAQADCCDWNACTPEIDRHYGAIECPIKHRIGSDGICDFNNALRDDQKKTSHPCKSFCQVQTTFVYDGEYPLAGTYSQGWGLFGSSQWMRFGMKWDEPIDLPDAPRSVLEDGISGGLSRANRGIAGVAHMDVELQEGECGYFTFLPMNKVVCGTYSHAKPWPKCDRDRMSKGNMCVTERSNWGDPHGFWWFANDVGEPTVRGHTTFVRTECDGSKRLPAEKQTKEYAFAMRTGQAMDDVRYEGWKHVWKNPALANKQLGGKTGPDDDALFCYASNKSWDKNVRDADVIHCGYAVGELLKTPDKIIKTLKKGEKHSFAWERGCQIEVQANVDFAPECQVGYAEVAAAANSVNFNCMKEVFLKNHVRFGVKGSHTIRGAGDKCAAAVQVWGGKGPGSINIGAVEDEDLWSGLDPKWRGAIGNLTMVGEPSAAFGDQYDPEWPEIPYYPNDTSAQDF